jgi:hypothetical protein
MENDLISRSALMKKVLVPPCSVVSVDDIKNAPAVDAVVLPSGKIGDVVKWNTGVSFRYFTIRSIIICHDGMRYDLGELAPFVNHRNIAEIMSEAEAEAESYEVD